MRKIRDVLRLRHEAKLSHEKIHLAVGISKGAVAKYLSLSKAQGLTWPFPDDPLKRFSVVVDPSFDTRTFQKR